MIGVDPQVLLPMVAAQLGVEPGAIESITIDEISDVGYQIPAITTLSREWVRGRAVVAGVARGFTFFVKVVQNWSRSPAFQNVPPEIREVAAAAMPWRTEATVYRSDLPARLPRGLRMPPCRGVFDVDELSCEIWLDEVVPTPGGWDDATFVRAARLLGRLAASTPTRERSGLCETLVGPIPYFEGRVRHQVMPVLSSDIWSHPMLCETFTPDLQQRIGDTVQITGHLAAELDAMPRRVAHGDACPNNLVLDRDGFIVIDFGLWSPQPVGFDLSQLVLGDIQIGKRPADNLQLIDDLCLASYVEGLRAEDDTVDGSVVERAHALQMWLYSGVSAVPFEMLDQPPSPALQELCRARATIATFALDRLDATAR